MKKKWLFDKRLIIEDRKGKKHDFFLRLSEFQYRASEKDATVPIYARRYEYTSFDGLQKDPLRVFEYAESQTSFDALALDIYGFREAAEEALKDLKGKLIDPDIQKMIDAGLETDRKDGYISVNELFCVVGSPSKAPLSPKGTQPSLPTASSPPPKRTWLIDKCLHILDKAGKRHEFWMRLSEIERRPSARNAAFEVCVAHLEFTNFNPKAGPSMIMIDDIEVSDPFTLIVRAMRTFREGCVSAVADIKGSVIDPDVERMLEVGWLERALHKPKKTVKDIFWV